MKTKSLFPGNVFQLASGLIVTEQQLSALMTQNCVEKNRINPCDTITYGTNHARNLLNNFDFNEIKKQAIELVDSLDGMNQVQHYVTLFKEQADSDNSASALKNSIISVTNEIEIAFSHFHEMLDIYFNLMQLVSDLKETKD